MRGQFYNNNGSMSAYNFGVHFTHETAPRPNDLAITYNPPPLAHEVGRKTHIWLVYVNIKHALFVFYLPYMAIFKMQVDKSTSSPLINLLKNLRLKVQAYRVD